jgi:hypothetical protein
MPVHALVGPLGARLRRLALARNIYISAWTARGDAWMRWCARTLPAAQAGVVCDDVAGYLAVCAQVAAERAGETTPTRTPWSLYLRALSAQAAVALAVAVLRLAGVTYDGATTRNATRRLARGRAAALAAEKAAAVVRREAQ